MSPSERVEFPTSMKELERRWAAVLVCALLLAVAAWLVWEALVFVVMTWL